MLATIRLDRGPSSGRQRTGDLPIGSRSERQRELFNDFGRGCAGTENRELLGCARKSYSRPLAHTATSARMSEVIAQSPWRATGRIEGHLGQRLCGARELQSRLLQMIEPPSLLALASCHQARGLQ